MAPASEIDFREVHRKFRPKVQRYLASVVGADEAADLTQVTMLKVSSSLAAFRGESSLATWIYRIATNVALDRLREHRPIFVAALDDAEAETTETTPPDLQAESAEAGAARLEMGECVREFVEHLPAQYRPIFVLAEVEGFTNAEIAEVTGLTVETVKIRLHRARARLRRDLREGCTIERDERNEIACDRRRTSD